MKRINTSLIIAALLSFCGITHGQNLLRTYQEYISRYSSIAVAQRKAHGIPASITLAQGILESAAGTSALAAESNNHFGIKCHNDWNGRRVYSDDDAKGECFRAYDQVSESYEDHAQFLLGKSRYASLFTLPVTDYKAWAHGLKKAGYATDPNYPNKLIKIIEDYQLYIYDMDNVASNNIAVTPVSTASTHASANNKSGAIRSGSNGSSKKTIAVNEKHKVYRNNWARCVVARSGDSYASIALETGVLLKNLYKFNDLEADRALAEGDVVYISRKRNVNNERTSHIVRVGESAWDIAQRYGIKVNSLYQMNGMEESRGVEVGQRLKLKR